MIKVKKDKEAIIPTKNTPSDAGYDLYSAEDVIIKGMERVVIGTGVCIQLPNIGKTNMDIYGRIAPRSGLAVNHGIDTMAGVIDREYTGEIKVCLYNTDKKAYEIKKGDRIAQLIPTYIYKGDMLLCEALPNTERSNKGFGSSGK